VPTPPVSAHDVAGGCCAAGFQSDLCPLWVMSGHDAIPRPCPLCPGDLNRSTQHLLILLDKEVADGDVTDIVHGEAKG